MTDIRQQPGELRLSPIDVPRPEIRPEPSFLEGVSGLAKVGFELAETHREKRDEAGLDQFLIGAVDDSLTNIQLEDGYTREDMEMLKQGKRAADLIAFREGRGSAGFRNRLQSLAYYRQFVATSPHLAAEAAQLFRTESGQGILQLAQGLVDQQEVSIKEEADAFSKSLQDARTKYGFSPDTSQAGVLAFTQRLDAGNRALVEATQNYNLLDVDEKGKKLIGVQLLRDRQAEIADVAGSFILQTFATNPDPTLNPNSEQAMLEVLAEWDSVTTTWASRFNMTAAELAGAAPVLGIYRKTLEDYFQGKVPAETAKNIVSGIEGNHYRNLISRDPDAATAFWLLTHVNQQEFSPSQKALLGTAIGTGLYNAIVITGRKNPNIATEARAVIDGAYSSKVIKEAAEAAGQPPTPEGIRNINIESLTPELKQVWDTFDRFIDDANNKFDEIPIPVHRSFIKVAGTPEGAAFIQSNSEALKTYNEHFGKYVDTVSETLYTAVRSAQRDFVLFEDAVVAVSPGTSALNTFINASPDTPQHINFNIDPSSGEVAFGPNYISTDPSYRRQVDGFVKILNSRYGEVLGETVKAFTHLYRDDMDYNEGYKDLFTRGNVIHQDISSDQIPSLIASARSKIGKELSDALSDREVLQLALELAEEDRNARR